MMPLLVALLDYEWDFERYDSESARDLFFRFGLSERAYREFVKPLLLVGLFKPPEELSAGVVLATLYYYALAHQDSFDVRWARGSVSELIFKPLIERIERDGGAIVGDRRVEDVRGRNGKAASVVARDSSGALHEYESDAVILATGVTGSKRIVSSSPLLRQEEFFRRLFNLSGIDCIATRLWLDSKASCRNPANVLANFQPDVGSTWFHLNDLHDGYRSEGQGSVIASDFYNASSLMCMDDEEIARTVKRNVDRSEPGFSNCSVVDYRVARFPSAVTHFSPGSYRWRPTQVCAPHHSLLFPHFHC